MWQMLDVLLFLMHLIVILFNTTGWIWEVTRKWHLLAVIITLISWFILGFWFGWGYCFLTDWHWDVKRKLGETGLPNSFIQYLAEQCGIVVEPAVTDGITAVVFAFSVLMAFATNRGFIVKVLDNLFNKLHNV